MICVASSPLRLQLIQDGLQIFTVEYLIIDSRNYNWTVVFLCCHMIVARFFIDSGGSQEAF